MILDSRKSSTVMYGYLNVVPGRIRSVNDFSIIDGMISVALFHLRSGPVKLYPSTPFGVNASGACTVRSSPFTSSFCHMVAVGLIT